MRYIWVSGRVPRGLPRFCAYCCDPIVEGYLRDRQTAIVYCGPHCYESHVNLTEQYLLSAARMGGNDAMQDLR